MDEKVIEGLVVAYQAAPSNELAKLIVFAYLDIQLVEDAIPYIKSLNDSLTDDELITLCLSLTPTQYQDTLVEYLSTLPNEKYHFIVEQLYSRNQQALAKMVYLQGKTKDNSLHSVKLETLLGIKQDKVKLHLVEKTDIASVTDLAPYRQDTTTFNDVVGLNKIKKQINKKIILPFQKPSLFQRFKKKIGGGVLLFGPPGCGKTLLARATAGECNARFFNIEVADVLDMYIGESEQKLQAIFEKARNETPAIIFFDELEALAGKREHARNSSTAHTVSQFLTELDGFSQNNHGILVLASTNVPWAIDSAFLRPGRFDRMFFIPPPDAEAREAILKHHMQERPATIDINFSALAKKTPGFSGADLAHLVEMAADEAIDETIETSEEVAIRFDHFKEALVDTKATTIEWLTTARNYARYANDGGRYNDVLEFLKKHGK